MFKILDFKCIIILKEQRHTKDKEPVHDNHLHFVCVHNNIIHHFSYLCLHRLILHYYSHQYTLP